MAEPTIYAGRQSKIGLLPQTVWGTAADETAVAGIIQRVEPPEIDIDAKIRNESGKLCSGNRWPDVLDDQRSVHDRHAVAGGTDRQRLLRLR